MKRNKPLYFVLDRRESRKEKRPVRTIARECNKQMSVRACLKNKMYRAFWWHIKQFKLGNTFFPAKMFKHRAIKAMQQLRKEAQCTSVIF
jgi:hypothetical protein